MQGGLGPGCASYQGCSHLMEGKTGNSVGTGI